MISGEFKTLTRNQMLVLRTLSCSHVPLGAYRILDQLREEGIRSPLQIYRALSTLMKRGLVYRLESLNAFIACSQRSDVPSEPKPMAFAICSLCGKVDHFLDEIVAERLAQWAKANSFRPGKVTLEIRGTCVRCTADAV